MAGSRGNRRGASERTAWGEQRARLNDRCYERAYAPGSVLADAHRFMNSFTSCSGSSGAQSRDGLFAEAKPAYLR